MNWHTSGKSRDLKQITGVVSPNHWCGFSLGFVVNYNRNIIYSRQANMFIKKVIQATIALAVLWSCEFMVNGQDCQCHLCEDPASQRTPERLLYWAKIANQHGSRASSFARNNLLGASQIVFLDFDSGNDGAIDYTTVMRDAVQTQLEVFYADFDVVFTQTNPGGAFSTLVFNEGTPGGVAEDVDFRNQNLNDNAVLNIDGTPAGGEAEIVSASAFIAAHELGHLLGLRHGDIYGPIGAGVLPGFEPFYDPDYGGPAIAFEAVDHVMATPAFGIAFAEILSPSWLSERSSIKLTFAEAGQTITEIETNDSLATAEEIDLQNFVVPNTIVDGQNTSPFDFSVSATVVEGTLNGALDPLDLFQFEAKAGDLFNLEVLSIVPDRLAIDPIDPNVSVFDSTGAFVDYYGNDAFNESELESSDAIFVDLIIPADGTYFVQVDSMFASDAGNYELFIYRFNGFQGDVNCDGSVDLLDVGPFVDAITNGDNPPKADINNDNIVNLLDIGPFVGLLSSN